MRTQRYGERSARARLRAAFCASLLGASLLGLVMAGFGIAAAPAAAAEAPPVEYRVDGSAWSATPPALFSARWVPVPGGSATSTLEVRANRAGTTIIAVYVGAVTSSSSTLLAQTTFTSGGTNTALADLASRVSACELVTPQTVLTAGQTLAVPVSLALASTLGDEQGETLGFSLLVAASETGPVTLSNGCPVDAAIVRAFPAASSVDLASTGSDTDLGAWLWPAALGAVGVGAGAALLVAKSARTRRGAP